jgi:hypothetical protein
MYTRLIKQVSIIFLFFCISCSNNKFPELNIIVDEPIGWDNKQSCRVVYSNRREHDTLDAGIKCRGGMSSKYFKHSYSLELDKKYDLLDINHEDDWIVNANYIDKTFMRHKISYDIFREMSKKKNVAAKCGYLNVFLNGKYNGLYVLMEEVNGKMVGLDKKDTLSMLFKDPPVFYDEKLSYVQDPSNYYHQKFPKLHDRDQSVYLEEFIEFMFHSSDADFAKNISEYIDIDNVIDWHILLLFTNNSDGIMKNFLLYKIDGNTPFRISVWDYDHSFGRDGDNEMNMMKNELNCKRSILLKRLMEIEALDYNEKLSKRWKSLREDNIISVKSLDKHIKRNHKIIKDQVGRNFEKWPVNEKWYYDDNNYHEELDLMSQFVNLRIKQLDEYFSYN